MRLNKFIASSTGMSRRAADATIAEGRVQVNWGDPSAGQDISSDDKVTLDGRTITPDVKTLTIMLDKPIGYVCSRKGQGSLTIYELLPPELHHLKPVGRLDKNSSGLLLLTNDGDLANKLTHPSQRKNKVYEVRLDKPLEPLHRQMISDHGVSLEDGPSMFELERLVDGREDRWKITMHEGRNRQIRRTFAALGYNVTALRRTQFGQFSLSDLADGEFKEV